MNLILDLSKSDKKIKEWEAGQAPDGPAPSIMDKGGEKGVRLSPEGPPKPADKLVKDMEHLAGEKVAPATPSSTKQATAMFGPSAAQQGSGARQTAVASSAPSPATKQALSGISNKPGPSETKQALSSIKPTTMGGATGAVSGAPSGVLTSAPAQPAAAPKKVAAMAKSAIMEATEILKGMIAKADHSPANSANEPGPVSGTPHGGSGPAQTSCNLDEEEKNPNGGPGQMSVSGPAHMGSGPAQTSVSGTPHGGSGPAKTSVSGDANPANVSKAIGARSMPKVPRSAMAMDMDSWRSATGVMTRANSRFAERAGSGPLHGEVLEFQTQAETAPEHRATSPSRHPVLKSCGGCGRTHTVHKGMSGDCPSCIGLEREGMAKSRGGMLIPSGI